MRTPWVRNAVLASFIALAGTFLWGEALTSEQAWALDLAMPLSVMNAVNYSTLQPLRENKNETDCDCEYWQWFLEETWGIGSREEYISVFDDISASGQSNSYTELLNLLEKNPSYTPVHIALHLSMEKYQCDRMYFILATKEWLGERSLRAWDLGRLVNVTRWACGAGYITEAEAWAHILPTAQILRTLYHSREDFLSSYIGGRGFFGSCDPWEYMEEVLASTRLEYQKLESRQHLPWNIPGENLERREVRVATWDDLSYTISDEQKAAQQLFASLCTYLNEYQNALDENAPDKIAHSLLAIRDLVSPYAINGVYPPYYYQSYYSEGLFRMDEYDYPEAFRCFKEAEQFFPNDSNLKKNLNRCEKEFKLRQNGPQGKI